MATTERVPQKPGGYPCPDCDEVFDNHRALNAHQGKHKRERDGARFSIKAQVAEAMRETVAPLQAQLDDINRQIDDHMRDVRELREARTMLTNTLKHLNPAAAKKAAGAASTNGAAELASRSMEQKVAVLRQLIETRPELFADGITANSLALIWKDEGLQPQVSMQKVRLMFEQLRDEGIMRADRVTKGGGMSWKLVGNDNGNGATDGA